MDARAIDQQLLNDLPYLDRPGNQVRTITQLIAVIEKNDLSLHGDPLAALATWMENYISETQALDAYWFELYLDRREFWDMLPNVVHALIDRRSIRQGYFRQQGADASRALVQSFLVAYAGMALRIARIDEQTLSTHVEETNTSPDLLSEGWLACLPLIMNYGADFWRSMAEVSQYEHYWTIGEIVKRFAGPPNDGLDLLAHLSELEKPQANYSRSWIYTQIVSSVFDCYRNHRSDDDRQRTFTTLPAQGFRYFLDAEKKLQFLIKKQISTLSMQNCEMLLKKLYEILVFVTPGNDAIITEMFDRAMPPAKDCPHDVRADLAINVWRMDLFKKCIMEGRMEIRVCGVDGMQQNLVDIYTHYVGKRPTNPMHPLPNYLSDWLLANRMVEYFVGVESHPQLIARASNVVGFLSVTKRYTTSETDTIWSAITSGQDPSKIEAVLRMVILFFNISTYSSLLYFVTKLSQTPIGNFDAAMIDFGRAILRTLRDKWSFEGMKSAMSMIPIHLTIRLIRESATEESLPLLKRRELQKWVMAELKEMLKYNYSDEDFAGIYEKCLDDIERHTEFASGSVSAIHSMFLTKQEEVKQLATNTNLTGLLVKDIGHVVKSEVCPGAPSSVVMEALDCRLKLLENIIHHLPHDISHDLAKETWDVTVGESALNDMTRGNAWASVRRIQHSTNGRNSFIEYCINDFLPKLPPSYFVRESINFAREVDQYRSRFQDRDSTEVQGRTSSGLLWHISLATPQEKSSVADTSIVTLIDFYLDSEAARTRTRPANDAVHVQLVERCIDQLTTAGSKLRSYSDGTSSGEDEPMVVVASEQEIEAQKLIFGRSLKILHEFVTGIRARPMYSPEPQVQPQLPRNFHDIKGTAVQLRYQAFGPKPTEIRTIDVGTLETAGELGGRLKMLTGFDHLRTIINGQELDLKNVENETIENLNLHAKGLLLIKKAASPGSVPDLARKSDLRLVEVEILSHFSELYQLLDLEEGLAKPVYTFLSAFPPHQSVTNKVCSSTTPFEVSFPVSSPFKILYSTYALRACLAHQVDNGIAMQNLVNYSIQSLTQAITNLALDQSNLTIDSEASVATALVECFLAFLRQPKTPDNGTISLLNTGSLVHRLNSLILRGIALSPSSLDARRLVCESFAACLEASVHSQEFRSSLVEASVLPSLLQLLLLQEPLTSTRHCVAVTIQRICSCNSKTSGAPRDLVLYLWENFVSVIPHCLDKGTSTEHFFDTANAIFRTVHSEDQPNLDLAGYSQSWCKLLLTHTHTEFVGRDEIDYVVYGLSRLIIYCFQLSKAQDKQLQSPDGFMEALFRKHLFPQISSSTSESERELTVPNLRSEVRAQLLDLIYLLSNEISNYRKLLALMKEIIPPPDSYHENDQAWSHGLARISDVYPWEANYNFERTRSIRTDTGHPGLRNLSNTCYMNSLLTQLFMNVKFRDFIVNVHVTDHAGSQKLLYETRKLFAYMQETYLKAVDTQSIADSIYLDGGMIDVTIQMDVDEFYNLLFDRWESQIVGEDDKKHFREFYGGQIVQQIKSRECSHISERLEPFFAVQCDITGKSSLKESLDAYVAGEVMEGDNKYSCTSCGSYVEAVKRACLKDIPDNLIFHLKRFDYDLMSGNRSKVNNRFEFPTEINMAEYHVDNLANPRRSADQDVFELVGVLVHTGTSESGHYYSYIKERPLSNATSNPWVEFNDMEVSFFDPEYIDEQCFGGWSDNPMFMNAQWKSWNAYMLFYERVGSNTPSADSVVSNGAKYPAKCKIPSDLKNEVDASNEHFLRQYCLLDPVHANFARNSLEQLRSVNNGTCTEDHVLEQAAIELALEYLDRYQSRTKDCPNHERMQTTLIRIFGACSLCSKLGLEWVIKHPFALRNLLLRCPMPKVRKDFAAMMLLGLQNLRTNDPLDYGFDESDYLENEVEENPIIDRGIFPELVSSLEGIYPTVTLSARGWDDYFGLLVEMVNMGKPEAHRVLAEEFLQKCLEILVCDSTVALRTTVLKERYQVYRRLVDKGKKFSFGKLSELLAILLERIDFSEDLFYDRYDFFSQNATLGPLTTKEDELIRLGIPRNLRPKEIIVFLEKLLNGSSNPVAAKRIIKTLLLARGSLKLTPNIRATLHAGISVDPAALAAPYLRAALVYCEYAQSITMAEGMVQFVAKEVDSIGRSGGREHLDFLMQARRLRSARHDVPPETFHIAVLSCLQDWAPGLLTYCEESVRVDTSDFLKTLIFNQNLEEIDDEEKVDFLSKVGKELCIACATRCDKELKKQEPLEHAKQWDQILPITRACIERFYDEHPEPQLQAIEGKFHVRECREHCTDLHFRPAFETGIFDGF